MKTGRVFYVGTHRYSFRPSRRSDGLGEPAEIIGVAFVASEGEEPRPCFHLRYENGTEDFALISETHHYKLISEADVKEGRIPAIVH